jgi:hypothetical protein
MKDYIPVEGNLHLVRDKKTGAILNLNKSGLEFAKHKKNADKKEKAEKQKLKDEVAELKKMVQDLIRAK